MSEFHAPANHVPASGWHKMEDATYFGLPAYGSHDIKKALASAAHVKGQVVTQSAAMAFGGAFHLYTLVNPALVVPMPEFNMRTNLGKEQAAAWRASVVPGSVAVSMEDYQDIEAMSRAVHAHRFGRAILSVSDGINEIAGVVNEGGAVKRIKPDRRIPSKKMIVDLKTASDIAGDEFSRAATKYRYWLQAAFYLDTANQIEQLLGTGIEYTMFLFLVVESSPPYGVRVYEVDQSGIELGREQYTKGWKRIEESVKTGVWAGYPQEVETLVPPAYAMYE